jgi:putative inorganic carbon (hco3(-)) transporter
MFAAYLALCIRRPAWGIGLILALLPAYALRFSVISIPTTALEVMVGVFLLSAAVLNFNRESLRKIEGLGKVNLWIGLFFMAGIISTIVSPEPTRALGQLKAFILEPILIFYAVIVSFKGVDSLRTPLKMLLWSASMISLFGAVQYYTHLMLPLRFWGNGEEMKRITSVFEYPNALALYLAPLLVFFLALYARGFALVRRHWQVLGLAVMSLAALLTYSRGAWLAIIVGLAVLLMRQSGVSLKRWASVAVIALLVLSPLLYTRFKATFNDASSSERLQLYRAGAAKVLSQPLLGNGLYGFRTTLEKSDYTGEILNYPHNIVLNFWLETGLVGLVSFLMLLYLAFKQYKKRPTVIRFAAGTFMLVMVAHGMVDAPYFKNDLSILFWFMLSLFYVEE